MFKIKLKMQESPKGLTMKSSTAEILRTIQGDSAYKIWLDAGNTGSEQDFLDSLQGKDYVPTDEDLQKIAEMVEVPELPEDTATEGWVKEYAQPKGDYIGKEQLEEAVADAVKDLDVDVDLDGYATEEWVGQNYQLKGDYLTQANLQTATNNALAQAKSSGEFDGEKGVPGTAGKDGYSPTVTVSKSGKVTTIKITDVNGTKTATINDGADGKTPVKGTDYFDGKDGYTPQKGKDYFDGTDGKNGYSIYTGTVSKEADGIMVSSYQTPTGYAVLVGDMIITPDGDLYRITSMPSSTEIYVEHTGVNLKGANGYTPVKGTDYYTPTEIEEVIEEVILQMGGQPVFGKVDSDNNIIITAPLADGDYAMKYENADGSFVSICTISVNGGDVSVEGGGSDEPALVNLIETAKTHTDTNTVFNGIGYMDGKYASSASPFYGTDASCVCTGLIPATFESVYYISGVTLDNSNHVRFGLATTNASTGALAVYTVKVINELSSYLTIETLAENYYKVTFSSDYLMTNCDALQYMWFSAVGTGDNLIVATTPIQ